MNSGIRHVSDGFDLGQYQDRLATLLSYPKVFHIYGSESPSVEGPLHWMVYNLNKGSIAFLRQVYREHSDIAAHVAEYIRRHIDLPIDEKRISLVMTQGSIPPHIDESGRVTVVNIGVRDTDSAVTWASRSKHAANWQADCEGTMVKVGSMYLLDTSSYHCVDAFDEQAERLMFSYAFAEPYDYIKSKIKEH